MADAGHPRRKLRGCQHHPIHLILQQVQDRLIAVGARIDRKGQDLPPLRLQTATEGMQHVDVERISKIAEDQGDNIGSLGREAAGDRIGHIVELARRREHLVASRLRNARSRD